MPTYATAGALSTAMPGVSFTGLTASADACIERAEARIDSVLARRYDLSQAYFQTSTATPPVVQSWAIQMGAGYLWQEVSRGGAGKEAMKRGETLIKGVVDDLKLLSEHKLDLVNSSGALIPDMSNGSTRVLSSTKDYKPTFNEGNELRWKVSSQKRQDIIDDVD